MGVAARGGCMEAMAWLAAHGAGEDVTVPDQNGRTPMHMAAFGGHVDVMAWLAEHGAAEDVRATDGTGAPPMAMAPNLRTIAWLAKRGAVGDVERWVVQRGDRHSVRMMGKWRSRK